MILIDENLFLDNLKDYENCDLDYVKSPDTVGIMTIINSTKKIYRVFLNDEKGYLQIQKDFTNFIDALKQARNWYIGIMSYYESPSQGIYFTKENVNKIYEKLKEIIDLPDLPTLGSSIGFGLGNVCLEETEQKYKFYIIDRHAKFEYEEFDNIEDAIQKLVAFYEENELTSNPLNMKEIFYQVLELHKKENDFQKLVRKKNKNEKHLNK